jgi:hypothetical protein
MSPAASSAHRAQRRRRSSCPAVRPPLRPSVGRVLVERRPRARWWCRLGQRRSRLSLRMPMASEPRAAPAGWAGGWRKELVPFAALDEGEVGPLLDDEANRVVAQHVGERSPITAAASIAASGATLRAAMSCLSCGRSPRPSFASSRGSCRSFRRLATYCTRSEVKGTLFSFPGALSCAGRGAGSRNPVRGAGLSKCRVFA